MVWARIEKRRGAYGQTTDGDGCVAEEKEMKTKAEAGGQHQT